MILYDAAFIDDHHPNLLTTGFLSVVCPALSEFLSAVKNKGSHRNRSSLSLLHTRQHPRYQANLFYRCQTIPSPTYLLLSHTILSSRKGLHHTSRCVDSRINLHSHRQSTSRSRKISKPLPVNTTKDSRHSRDTRRTYPRDQRRLYIHTNLHPTKNIL
jgi:hypothetical protein